MKKIIVFSFLLISVGASAQNDVAEDTVAKPAITAIGKPDGAKAEMKIGEEGGSFTSSDGKVRLIIPEGAVSKKTAFSIQPTTNLAPNGNGKSYQMEPSGINFQKPLQIIFYYANTEIKGNSPELLGIAVQDDKGQWSSPNKIKPDSVAKTLTTETWHFSSYVLYYSAVISPESARVKVNGSLRLKIIGVLNIIDGEDAPFLFVKNEYKSSEVWSVNGVPKGNATVGLISTSQNYSAIFQAPAQVPSQNPVAVSVQETYYTEAYSRWDVYKLVSNITIYDGDYIVYMESLIKSGGKGVWGGIKTIADLGRFTVSLEKNKAAVIDIKNMLEIMKDDCKNELLNPTTCTGLLHVAGIKDIKVTPANPPGQPYPIVEIWFVPYPIEFSRVSFDCPPPPGGTKGHSIGAQRGKYEPPKIAYGALPHYIKFFAKDGEQIIIESPKDSDEGYLKIWVRQLKDD